MNSHSFDSSHTKTNILLQAHFSQLQLPSTDYYTDTKSVLDQAIRVLQAMLDVSADQGWLITSLRVIQIIQMIVQGRWWHDSSLLQLPHMTTYHTYCFRPQSGGAKKKGFPDIKAPVDSLPELMAVCDNKFEALSSMLDGEMNPNHINEVYDTLSKLPHIRVEVAVKGWWAGQSTEIHKPFNIHHKGGRRSDNDWVQVHADQEYVLQINMTRIKKAKRGDSKVCMSRFPKMKDEGWMIVVGDVEMKEVIALKRVGYNRGQTNIKLALTTPEKPGRVIYTLYLMSDSYLGLDQQYDLCLEVIPSDIEAQVNTELKDELEGLNFDDS
ncbi:activating signal cointegrator 1 complex subunit 3-like [Patella vulgata]|uniref:activating signal cointegrator 1 complex subunit 3-like n=1 Tax=Patella vulgata TaxID=6465 RepID=UPI0024A83991|nr:activating signal cointegrator 1 complex subunit 3-like [Patella vulgata]